MVLPADAAVPSLLLLHVQVQGCCSAVHAHFWQLLALRVQQLQQVTPVPQHRRCTATALPQVDCSDGRGGKAASVKRVQVEHTSIAPAVQDVACKEDE
jgi:hypothetical protein